MPSPVNLAVKKVLQEQPDWQLLIIASLQLSEESPNGIFWGGASRNRAQCPDNRSLTHLRALGILETVEKSTRNYSSASYRMRDREGVRQALTEMGIDPDVMLPGDFFNSHKRKQSADVS
jgi:hypothetical protein